MEIAVMSGNNNYSKELCTQIREEIKKDIKRNEENIKTLFTYDKERGKKDSKLLIGIIVLLTAVLIDIGMNYSLIKYKSEIKNNSESSTKGEKGVR